MPREEDGGFIEIIEIVVQSRVVEQGQFQQTSGTGSRRWCGCRAMGGGGSRSLVVVVVVVVTRSCSCRRSRSRTRVRPQLRPRRSEVTTLLLLGRNLFQRRVHVQYFLVQQSLVLVVVIVFFVVKVGRKVSLDHEQVVGIETQRIFFGYHALDRGNVFGCRLGTAGVAVAAMDGWRCRVVVLTTRMARFSTLRSYPSLPQETLEAIVVVVVVIVVAVVAYRYLRPVSVVNRLRRPR
mmetsp:Transcript_19065/g.44822  ORF Transcript_19065/g.44822 Transcript_19065/m.44822 type:complete len:236 (-) Transcript_19065:794-1501(-)